MSRIETISARETYQSSAPWAIRFQLRLFVMINGYGERALMSVGWFLLVFLIGTFVYRWNGDLAHP